jgi:hypothetical protein
MTRPLSFDHLQAILRQHTAGLPDVRKPSPNRLCWLSHKFVGNSLDMPSLKRRKIGTLPL